MMFVSENKIEKGLYDSYSMLFTPRFNSHVVKGKLEEGEKLLKDLEGFEDEF